MEIKEDFERCQKNIETDNTSYWNLWNIAKAALRRQGHNFESLHQKGKKSSHK